MAATLAGSSSTTTTFSCDGAVNGDVVAPINNINKKVVNIEEEKNLDSVVSSTSSSLYFANEPFLTSTPKAAATLETANNLRRDVIDKQFKNKNFNKVHNTNNATASDVLNFKHFAGSRHGQLNQIQQHTFSNKYKAVSTLFVVGKQLLALAIVFLLTVLIYKMVLVAAPFANSDSVSDFALITQHKLKESLNWLYDAVNRFGAVDLRATVTPLLCGLLASLISITVVYLDSSKPGIYPPSPLTPRSKHSYYRQRSSSLYLSYITAITSGLVVGALLYFNN